MSPKQVPQKQIGNRWFFDPHAANQFFVEIAGVTSGRFMECSGLSMTNEINEIKEGGLNSSTHKFINRSSAGEITLKRGFWSNPLLFSWFEQAALDSWTPRKNGTIVVLAGITSNVKDSTTLPVARWDFYRAFPLKWDGPQFNATSNSLAMESVTLACEWIELRVKFELDGGDWF
ncbi:MAG: phage tail protein [Bradymonadales bacterium]|nr:phage tail protein [Bradymonadales bacterium]